LAQVFSCLVLEVDMFRLITILLVLAVSTSSFAVVETAVVSASSSGNTNLEATLDMPQHNEALLGDLLSVSLHIEGSIDGFFYFENLGSGWAGYRIVDLNWALTADFLGENLIDHTGIITEPGFTWMEPFDGLEDYAGTSGTTLPYDDMAEATRVWLPGDPGFDSFSGNGTIPLDVVSHRVGTVSTSGSPTIWGLTDDGLWTATITYEYDPATVDTDQQSWSGVKALYR
jgi:hypothetical protein